MRKIVALLFICAAVCLASACEPLDKLTAQMKSNIEDIAGEFSDANDSAEKYKPENSISLGVADFDTFNPLLTKSQTVREAMQLVYEPLFETDESGRANPILASGYNVSADGLTYVIEMKDGVIWHDGKSFDAYDAAYTIKQLLNAETPYSENLKEMSDYLAVSDNTLRITLKRPVSGFVNLLNFPIIKYGTEAAVNPSYKPIGTGAFAYAGEISFDRYEFNAFDDYHRGKAKIDKVYIKKAPDSEKYMSLFAVSETDVISGLSADLSEYTPKGENKSYEFVSNKLVFIGFNTEKSVISEAETRRGIAAAADKLDIVNSVIYSKGEGVNIPINPKSVFYYDTEVNLNGSREKALELFGNDGWGEGSDGYLRRTSGKRSELFIITILTDRDDRIKTEIAEKIKAQCEKCGIKTAVDAVSNEVYNQKIAAHDFDLYVGECSLGANGDVSPLVLSKLNPFGYSSDEADMLISQAGMTQNEESLKEIYKSIGNKITNDAPFVPLYFIKDSVASSGRIKDGISPVDGNIYRNSYLWQLVR